MEQIRQRSSVPPGGQEETSSGLPQTQDSSARGWGMGSGDADRQARLLSHA